MAILDLDGLISGDRIRRCSNAARLYYPYFILGTNGYGRLELNAIKIIGEVFHSFKPVPSESEIMAHLAEYRDNWLLFPYSAPSGALWGHFEIRPDLLKRFKTAADRRSPAPPEAEMREWLQQYAEFKKGSQKVSKGFLNSSEGFLTGVGVGVGEGEGEGKNTCASGDARLTASIPSINETPFETTEPDGLFKESTTASEPKSGLREQQDAWFSQWWEAYWLRKARKQALAAFRKHVRSEATFARVMAATEAQTAEMLSRKPWHRPHGSSWLNGERWNDEAEQPAATSQFEEAGRLAFEALQKGKA